MTACRPALALLALCVVSPALAADLRNRDDVAYDIRIHDYATTHSSIEGNTTRLGVCTTCRLEVVGIGEVEVDESVDAVVIENGELRTE
ncbi:MAG: hypothetical protein ACFCVH_22835 [Alphaproteobacteria bacterium]